MKPLHFGWYWQGVHLRVVGVCDSKSLVAAPDVITRELNDQAFS
jgi:hypothetical protein